MMPTAAETYASYLPGLIRDRFVSDHTPLQAPEVRRFPAAVLLADLCDFTPLAERLARKGPAGAEELTDILNVYFDRVIETILAHGGDAVKLGGDAVTAVWKHPDEDLATLARRAAQCSLVLQGCLEGLSFADNVRLTLRVALGAGEVTAMTVGGVQDRWETLLAGAPMAQVSLAERQAQPGEVLLSPPFWELVQGVCAGERLVGGSVRLNRVRQALSLRETRLPTALPEAAEALRRFLPGPVRAQLRTEEADWLAELRQLSVLFVKLPDLNQRGPEALGATQAIFEALQTALYRYEGSVNTLTVDDKGVTLIAAMGLPPLAHEDDAVRASLAAREMQVQLAALGERCAIGVATGRLVCGVVGSARRCEYTMNGSTMARAARLMQAACDEVLCDEQTCHAARGHLAFAPLAPITLKGRAEPVAVFRPLGHAARRGSLPPLLGRVAERAILQQRLTALTQGRGGTVVIEGEPGMGKSRLTADLCELAQARDVRICQGAGDALDRSTPYHAWRPVFLQVFGIEGVTETSERRERVLAHLDTMPAGRRLAPLLGSVLSLDLPDNETTASMTGPVRADNTRDLLAGILEHAARRSPTLLVLEDIHWFDSASWALTAALAERVAALLLALTTRPLDTPPLELGRLLAREDALALTLDSLPCEATALLACQRLGVGALPEAITNLLYEKGQGNPFFTEELAFGLRDTGVVCIAGGQCRLAPGVDLRTITFPETVQGVITQRIDRLPIPQQLTLKTASVIGRNFPFSVLHDIYPVVLEQDNLAGHLDALERLSFTPRDPTQSDLAYFFKHVLVQEAAYNLMLFAQRRQLHRSVAEWYERVQSADTLPFLALLAHHWGQAEEDTRALEYLARAGEQALRDGAYQEARTLLTEALTVEARSRSGPLDARGGLRRACWERLLGECCLGLGQLPDSRTHTGRALELLGRPVPVRTAALTAGLLRQALRQAWFRLRPWPGRQNTVAHSEIEPLQEATRAFEQMAKVCYYGQEKLVAMHTALHSLNAAERLGPSVELARGYGAACLSAGLIPAHAIARAYRRRARAVAEGEGESSSLAWVLELTGIYSLGIGEWAEAEADLGRATELNERLGDWRQWEESLSEWTCLDIRLGRYARADERLQRIQEVARQRGHTQMEDYARLYEVSVCLRRGDFARAGALMEAGALRRFERPGGQEAFYTFGLLAGLYARRGDLEGAWRIVCDTLPPLRQAQPVGHHYLDGYTGIAEACLAVWAQGGPDALEARWMALAACALLRRMARVFPIAAPCAWLCRGRADALAGKITRARSSWRKALDAAQRLAMPYEEAQAHFEMAQSLQTAHPAHASHLARAREIFSRLGSAHELRPSPPALDGRRTL